MAITYRETNTSILWLKRYNKDNDSYSSIGHTYVDFDIIPTDAEVGDAILIQGGSEYGGQFYKLEFDVSSNVIADTIEGVWEYYSVVDFNVYNNDTAWKPLQNVVDDGDSFQTNTDGKVNVSWDMPYHWDNYCNPRGQSTWYQFNIRFRITNISNVTQTGRITNVAKWTDAIEANVGSDTSVTLEDIYQADVANGWNVVTKNGESNYTFSCSLYVSNSIFYSSDEVITFIDNRTIDIHTTAHWGELTSTGQPYKGCTLRFEGANSYYSSILGQSRSTFYALRIQLPRTARSLRSQGFTGAGIGKYSDQQIKGGDFFQFRNYEFSNSSNIVSGLTYSGGPTEPAGATLFDLKCVSSTYAVRCRLIDHIGDYFHRCDFTDVSQATSNPLNKLQVLWEESFVDCKINESLPLAVFASSSSNSDEYRDKSTSYRKHSFQSYALNNTLAGVSDVNVSIFDKDKNLVNSLKSNEDGGIGVNNGVTTNSGTDTLEYSGYDGSDKRFHEILMTNGVSKDSRSIIHKATDSYFTLAEPFRTAFDEGDNFIEIPYIIYQSQRADQTAGAFGYNYEPLKTHGPFRVSYRKFGYISSDDSKNFSAPVVSNKSLSINPFITKSEADAGNITGINIDGVAKTVTITEANTVNDLYDYCQWWHTRQSNLIYDEPITTIEGINYILADGWTFILSVCLSGGINITGNAEITDVFNLTDISVTDTLTFDKAGTYTFTDCVIGTVFNNSGGDITINTEGTTSVANNPSGSNITIVETYTLTLENLISGSIVDIYDNEINDYGNNNTKLAETTNSDTTYTYTHDGTSNDIVIEILKSGYKEVSIKYTLTDDNQSVVINQEIDIND